MLGIDDPLVALAYILSLGSAILCGVYGLICWNRGDDEISVEDLEWAAREHKADQES